MRDNVFAEQTKEQRVSEYKVLRIKDLVFTIDSITKGLYVLSNIGGIIHQEGFILQDERNHLTVLQVAGFFARVTFGSDLNPPFPIDEPLFRARAEKFMQEMFNPLFDNLQPYSPEFIIQVQKQPEAYPPEFPFRLDFNFKADVGGAMYKTLCAETERKKHFDNALFGRHIFIR